jgi:hypothetical protein
LDEIVDDVVATSQTKKSEKNEDLVKARDQIKCNETDIAQKPGHITESMSLGPGL